MKGSHQASGHAFISYIREDRDRADELQQVLQAAGIRVWRDTISLWPGEDWRAKIRNAITADALVFVACFSKASVSRERSYQNEELMLAIEQLRLRRPDNTWLIPVRFDDCEIPDYDIGGGRTLATIQRVDLFGNRSAEGAARLVVAVLRILGLGPAPPIATGGQAPAPAIMQDHNANRTSPASQPGKPNYMFYATPRVEGVLFELNRRTGGLIIYTDPAEAGRSFDVWINGNAGVKLTANAVRRTINGATECAAVFPKVLEGRHNVDMGLPRIKGKLYIDITVFAGQVAEIDLR